MGLDINKLHKVKYRGECIIAQCPACVQLGHDNKGEHLFIDSDGRFGCVIYPGDSGRKHRKNIFKLAGDKKLINPPITITVHQANKDVEPIIISKNILGHLGRLKLTPDQNSCDGKSEHIKIPVPGVPTDTSVEISGWKMLMI